MTADQKTLWDKIEQFDFDHPASEYGFSARLAKENYWTRHFTQQAILEYKKFMFLAATSEGMVSPSSIVDTVWHQHLVFTQSYHDFCELVGKQVQHVPSTHNQEDFQKFKRAKERTGTLYEEVFGKQPAAIWNYQGMFESLKLKKAKLKLRVFVIIGIFAFVVVAVPFYFLLRSIYVHIDNPSFIFGFTGLSGITFLALEVYNSFRLKRITREFDKESFIYSLDPYELVYLDTQKLPNVVHGVVNELVKNEVVDVYSNNTMELSKNGSAATVEQLQVTSMLNLLGPTTYQKLMVQMLRMPVFGNIANSMDAFKKYFNKSVKFGKLFYFNFIVLGILLLLSFTRLVTGVLRHKPVLFISIIVIVLLGCIVLYLMRLTKLIGVKTIPHLYKKEILPAMQEKDHWQWTYFLLGSAVLTASTLTLIDYLKNENATGSNGNTDTNQGCGSGGNGDGGSCGSSCGGCGGCGD